MTKGPVIIIEDDTDDQEIYSEAIKALGIQNEIRFFENGKLALEYLNTTEDQPFLILSDINMPEMTGLALKKHIQEDPYLCTKGIPFIFISTNANLVSVRHGYALSIQGYFQKPNTMTELKDMLHMIFGYWERCRHPNNS